jgi:4-amino-4-deoxychorismate lyase
MVNLSKTYWYQGKLREGENISLNINDPGFLYGATIFTTLRVYSQSLEHPLTHWQSHCDRLSKSLTVLGWSLPNWDRLYQGAQILAQNYPVLRLTIFPDGRELILPRQLPENLSTLQKQGIHGKVVQGAIYQRYLPEHKTGNYLAPWLAKKQASEAILTDSVGNWLETSTGNLWSYQQGCWYIPPIVGNLPGIGQQYLRNWLIKQDIPVKERQWSPDWVLNSEAIAYSNSVVEIIPFHTIDTPTGVLNLNPNLPALTQLRCYFVDLSSH